MPDPKRPAAANYIADEESSNEGLEGEADVQKDLFALKVMRDRGLMDEATYQARYEALTKSNPDS